jgi:ADP-heptose:LPS heptosyltransferase
MSEARLRVALFRALKLGDLLCAVPAFRALRSGLPDAHVTLIGLPWAATFVERFPHLLDELLPFPGWPGLPEQDVDREQTARFLAEARSRRFDLAVQMHGAGVASNAIVASLGAASTGGFVVVGAEPLDPERSIAYPDDLHEVHRHLALVEHLGFPSAGDHLGFPVHPDDRAALGSLLPGAPGCVVLHVGAISGRRWSPERFAALADVVGRDRPVVLTGTEAERAMTAAVAERASVPVVDLAGRTSLGVLAALIEAADLVVTNDTGVSHLTAAIGTPSVVLFLSSDPRRWAPLDAERHRAVVHPAIARAHAAHPERRGALAERCITDGCERHAPAATGDPDDVTLETVLGEVAALRERSPLR